MDYVALIPLLPALAFALMVVMSNRVRNASLWVSLSAIAGSLVLSLYTFTRVPGGEEAVWTMPIHLAEIGARPLEVGLRLDAVSAIMLLVVTIVGLCVQVYSLSYMKKDRRKGWYFAVLSLFTSAMLLLVLSGDFLLLYMSWEIMGLCSFLLIGFWHEQAGPRAAAIKAFLTTRVGDVGFAIGLAVMWATVHTFNMHEVAEFDWSLFPAAALAVSLLLFFGAMGKSAQVPLHVWLPDAMAGPTPASALIHAATMVAAGVYLVIRAMPIFHQASPVGLHVVMVIGVTTALLGGMLAVVQYDIKKILAYSTISQLGFMFVALGAGNTVAALFHLVTHAFFKSLLFLGAGVIIHATHTQDIREMGGLRRAMPWTTGVFTIGALALAGLPGLSGFFSKDEILVSVMHVEGDLYSHAVRWLIVGLMLFAAGLTAFYVTRLWVRVFGDNACSLAHESHLAMLVPMVTLAAITVFVGWTQFRLMEFLGEHGAWPDPLFAGMSVVVFLVGVGGGYLVYGRNLVDREKLRVRFSYLYGALRNGFYFDWTYDGVFVRPFFMVTEWLSVFDGRRIDGAVNGAASGWSKLADGLWVFDGKIIDGAVNDLASFVKWSGSRVAKLQVGRVQVYQRLAYVGLFGLLAVIAFVAWFVNVVMPMLRGA